MQQKILTYPVILTEYHDDGHYYVVTSPNIKGLVTDGETLTKALLHAKDAIATMLADTKYPAVQDPRKWVLKKNQQTSWVTVDMTKWLNQHEKKVRKNITIPVGLNKWAKRNKINVSKVATQALMQMKEA